MCHYSDYIFQKPNIFSGYSNIFGKAAYLGSVILIFNQNVIFKHFFIAIIILKDVCVF